MSGPLVHSPAEIIRHLFVNLGAGVLPTAGGSWPIYVASEPSDIDSIITLYDTAGIVHGREHIEGVIQEHYGIQVLVRTSNPRAGYTKAAELSTLIDETIKRNSVTISSTNYFVEAITRTTTVLALGKNAPIDNRNHFTINAIVALKQV